MIPPSTQPSVCDGNPLVELGKSPTKAAKQGLIRPNKKPLALVSFRTIICSLRRHPHLWIDDATCIAARRKSALFESEELVSDTHRARRVKLHRLAFDLDLLIALNDVRAVERTVILDPQYALLIEADRRMIA